MGSTKSKPKSKKKNNVILNPLSLKILKNLKNIIGIKKINKYELNIIFPHKTFFLEYFIKWILFVNNKKIFDEISFLMALEILFLEPKKRTLKKYNDHYTNFEYIIWICLRIYPTEFPSKINYKDIFIIVKFIINFYLNDLEDINLIFVSLKRSFFKLENLDENVDLDYNTKYINFKTFKNKFQEIFSNIANFNITLRNSLLINPKNNYLPIFSENKILNNQILFALSINNSKIYNNHTMNRIYYCDNNSYSFINFSTCILNLDFPILILIKNEYYLYGEIKEEIIGAYINCKIKQNHRFYGDEFCFLFSITPNTNFFYKKNDYNNNKYIFLSLKGKKRG